MLADHIRALLQHHDCVIIPDFGGLIADYAPARIHPVRHTLAPPAKRVAFNQSLTRNDGLLVDALSARLSVSTAQARELVQQAVQRMQQELAAGNRTELGGVGTFRQASGRGLEFEYTGSENLLGASFGLPELVSRPVRATDALLARERPVAAPQLRTQRLGRVWRMLGVTAIAGLVLSANYMFADLAGYLPDALQGISLARPTAPVPAPRQQASLSSAATHLTESTAAQPTNEQPAASPEVDEWSVAATSTTPAEPAPVATAPAPASKPAAAVAALPDQGTKPAAPKAAAKPKAKAPGWEKAAATNATAGASAATVNKRTGRYYVIAGSYTTLVNAEKGRQALVRMGHPARVLLPAPGSRQFMLSAADFPDRTSADRQASILRKRMGDLWIKQY
ncbi:HU-CCDC81 and SPOR domain-containing protein [Hymenobacter lapidiphilus]|uniref:HU-CCDC81 and SPOR domain-containing protein n=1 Tax=Hymenobacter lapidiphilus TaxID=2608003 RepID=A0A7Y7PKM9_9BACT|nr:HU-CCDC81 and SPOR domain-containing protein [Hymenobacter lapidiphilus]NVO29614.1 HU-CCDC81 and SPOR domain-containing protein [Hymenobacter lapidiphilus]